MTGITILRVEGDTMVERDVRLVSNDSPLSLGHGSRRRPRDLSLQVAVHLSGLHTVALAGTARLRIAANSGRPSQVNMRFALAPNQRPAGVAHYPVPCPTCHALAGYARSVQSDGTAWFSIELRCDACPHFWTERQNMALTVSQRMVDAMGPEAA
jgi:hypothetical protein